MGNVVAQAISVITRKGDVLTTPDLYNCLFCFIKFSKCHYDDYAYWPC